MQFEGRVGGGHFQEDMRCGAAGGMPRPGAHHEHGGVQLSGKAPVQLHQVADAVHLQRCGPRRVESLHWTRSVESLNKACRLAGQDSAGVLGERTQLATLHRGCRCAPHPSMPTPSLLYRRCASNAFRFKGFSLQRLSAHRGALQDHHVLALAVLLRNT